MNTARTPREAKQEFLNDLIVELRKARVSYVKDENAAEVAERLRLVNIETVKKVAGKHGLFIPPENK